jgi:nucleotide-binding universal stress UspA family protein
LEAALDFELAGNDLDSGPAAQLEDDVRSAADRLAAQDRVVEHRVRLGRPSTMLCETGKEMDADLIMVGSRGHGPIATMLLGSVSAEVVDHADRPGLVARGRTICRILLALDGSSTAHAAERVLTTWPIFAGARVDVVSVARNEPFWDGLFASNLSVSPETRESILHDSRRKHQNIAAAAARRLTVAGIDAETIVPAGDPANELTRVAQQHHADLVVLGTRGNTGLRRLVIGSVARNVLSHVRCSVLVVPRPA